MILFTVLLVIVILLAIFLLVVLAASGAAFIAIFGDLIVCVAMIWLILKLFRRKRRR